MDAPGTRSAHASLPSPADDGEAVLWRRWRDGGSEEARQELLIIHLQFARMMAASFYRKRLHDEIEFQDYMQLAAVGLVEAMDRFNPAHGVRFRTFASRRIHGALVDGLEKATEKQQQIAARRRLEADRLESIALGDAPDRVLEYVAEAGLAFALSWLLDGSRMIETGRETESMPFYRSVEIRQLRQQVLDTVASLSEQERTVIRGHYLEDLPFETIARRLQLTRGRVSQVHRKALARLREKLRGVATCDVLA